MMNRIVLFRRAGRAARRCSRAARARRAARVRLRARVGRAGAGARRRPGRRVGRHHRAAGPAPDPGQAQPDRARAQRRPGGLHRRRAGDRLAAGAAAAVGQRQGAAGAARQLRRRRLRAQARGARRSSTASQGDVHAAGNPHIQTDPRNIALVAAALGDAAAADRSGATRPSTRRRQADFTQRWQQAIARWTAQAAPLQGRGGRRRSTRPSSISTTGSA